MEKELVVITEMGFSGYFLVVADYVRYAKEKGIPVGPGRGSSAGSLVRKIELHAGMSVLRQAGVYRR